MRLFLIGATPLEFEGAFPPGQRLGAMHAASEAMHRPLGDFSCNQDAAARLLRQALSAEEHLDFVRSLDDGPDLATT